MELRWFANPLASCLHAAAALAQGNTLTDAKVARQLAEPTATLCGALAKAGICRQAFFHEVVPPATATSDLMTLADHALAAASRRQSPRLSASHCAELLEAIYNPYHQALPDIEQQLQLRCAPLRSAAESRLPGLLHQVGKLTRDSLRVGGADVFAVHPISGGGGAAHIGRGSVRIEAVLANPHWQLPEVLRLAWLLCQLELTKSEAHAAIADLDEDHLLHVGRYALLPVLLAAAETVELAHCNTATLQLAIEAWHLDDAIGKIPASLLTWWEEVRRTGMTWAGALAQLDRRISA